MKPWLSNAWRLALAAGLVAMGADLARAESADTAARAAALYKEHCVACHGEQRLGGMGPALLPQSLERLKPAEARQVITHGRAAKHMHAFKDKLDAVDFQAQAQWI
jgi:mono/diheme cytochrome c family protein